MGIILLDRENTCMCDQGTKCILENKTSGKRCTKKELTDAGYTAMQLKEVKKERSWLFEPEERKRSRIFSSKKNI